MGFQILCHHDRGTCLESGYIEDGYDNTKEFTFKVIGENIIEVKCKKCGNTVTISDGKLQD